MFTKVITEDLIDLLRKKKLLQAPLSCYDRQAMSSSGFHPQLFLPPLFHSYANEELLTCLHFLT